MVICWTRTTHEVRYETTASLSATNMNLQGSTCSPFKGTYQDAADEERGLARERGLRGCCDRPCDHLHRNKSIGTQFLRDELGRDFRKQKGNFKEGVA